MPNILFDNTCNLKCPYCFSDITREEDKQWLTSEALRTILEWSGSTNRIGIIGGEPTLHPQFNTLLKQIITAVGETTMTSLINGEIATPVCIFTNGIELYKWIEEDIELYKHPSIRYLINVNQLNTTLQILLERTIQDLINIGQRNAGALGCNLYYHNDIEYNWYWNLIDKYQIENIRVSVVSPANLFSYWRNNRFVYFDQMKPHFLSFIRKAKERGLHTDCIDCGYIPDCMFTDEELTEIYQVIDNPRPSLCEPIIDISPDLSVISCFGSCSEKQPLSKFKTMNDAIYYFNLIHTKKQITNIQNNHCISCRLGREGKCQAGCLCFAGME